MDFNKVFFMRPTRVVSYFLVNIKKYRYLPFFSSCSAVLLDISFSGLKLNIEGDYKLSSGQQFWLSIPLAPVGIFSPSKLVIRCECKWFDSAKMRAGCIFVNPNQKEERLIDQIITQLLKNNNQERTGEQERQSV